MPLSVRPALKRLARRLAIGLFLDVWPAWAVASLLLAGLVAVVCRMFFPGAASRLHWLWLAPVLTALPALIACARRAYRPAEVVAVADWLNGGQGMLLTLFENDDLAWAGSPLAEHASKFSLPRLRPWRKLAALPAGGGVSGHGAVASPTSPSRNEGDSCRRYCRQSRGDGSGVEATGVDYRW